MCFALRHESLVSLVCPRCSTVLPGDLLEENFHEWPSAIPFKGDEISSTSGQGPNDDCANRSNEPAGLLVGE